MRKTNNRRKGEKPAKQNGSMTEVAYEKLKAMILNNWVVPGQKLNNPDLVKKLKMSKTPIISALSRLEAEGYVHLKPNQGYYISDVAPSEILQAMEARVMLETANMDAVVARVTDRDLDTLEKINEAYRMKLKPYFDVESLPLNLEFHRTLARIGENQFMIQYIEKINEWIAVRGGMILSRYLAKLVTSEDAQAHSQVIEALRKKNGESAKILLSNHLRWVLDYFRQHLDEFENYYMG